MAKRPINDVLARNLKHYMEAKQLTQTKLAELAGMGQTTVSLYLDPSRRQPSKSGKPPSAKLGEVESMAQALEIEVWELLRDMNDKERDAYKQIEHAFNALRKPEPAAAKAKSPYTPPIKLPAFTPGADVDEVEAEKGR